VRRTLSTLSAVALLMAGFAQSAAAEEHLLDRVAAVVNGRVITLSEVQQLAGPALARLPDGVDRNAARLEVMREALDALIDEKILEDAVAERQIEVTDVDVDRAITEVRRQHGLTEAQFRQAIAEQGYSWEAYRQELAGQLERYKLLGAEVRARVEVSDEDVQSYLARQGGGGGRPVDEGRVRHVLVRVADGADEAAEAAARARAEEALGRIAGGESFADVARDLSEDPSSERGGELGWIRRGVMVAALDEAVFGAEVGKAVGPIRSPFGFHVLEVTERRRRRSEQDAFAEQRARQALTEEALEQETRRFLDGLRSRAVIEIKLSELAS
jgi:peptidyl-prolyl cis-trans isomerase SurA